MMFFNQKDINRFWNYVDIKNDNDCWNWQSSIDKDGYGRFDIKRKHYGAHRFSYMVSYGEILNKLWVLHSCDNRSCVNPNHLRLGTVRENVDDSCQRNRNVKGEKHGRSKLKDDDILLIRSLHCQNISYNNIMQIFNISKTTVSRIILRKTWKHI